MVTDRGAAVINNSWGYRTEECGDIQGSPVLDEALDYAHFNGRGGLGTSITFSMGNQSCHSQVQPLLSHPAAIGVGAVNKSSVLHGYSNTGIDVDVVAPSTDLRTTDIVGPAGMNGMTEDYTKNMGGTSGACPIVSGVIALMYEANPRLSADEVQVVLCSTADRIQPEQADYDAVGWSSTYGCGRVDAAAAVAAVFNRPPSAPTWRLPASGATVFADEVLLAWEPSTDLDDDPIRYSIELRPSSPPPGDDDDSAADDDDSAGADEDDTVVVEGVRETFWQGNLEGLSQGTWHAEIWATDSWGRGVGSEVLQFEVAATPPETGDDDNNSGCSCQSGQSGPLTALLVLLGLPVGVQRRRHSPRPLNDVV
jgi:MYXO-CTERM domain-containing protein